MAPADDASEAVPGRDENPYAAFIADCGDDAAEIQRRYEAHRAARNGQHARLLLAPDFGGLAVDSHLVRLEREPGFRDERNCLVFWARPPIHLLRLAGTLQEMLRQAAPHAWLMPTYRMHMTTLEVAFSKTPGEIASLVSALRPALPRITSHTYAHRARLVRPLVSHDLSAFALSLLPAAGEPTQPDDDDDDGRRDDAYSYHHLRRDLFGLVRDAGLDVASRYQVPSAHLTLGRFLDDADHDSPEKRRAWLEAVDGANRWLRDQVWDRPDGEWRVGHEKGLDARCGALWYGGGRTVMMGEGF
ncbi:hypothetical protein CDD83_7932 [Cordyceps sp. RAO-2017]|nr:hypothetical protein CDD83_7932 [Cordyceps sp. RAO-2017]